MKHLLLISICFTMATAAVAQNDGDRQKIQGAWVGYVVDGTGENPDRGPLHLQLTITGNTIRAINLQDGNKSLGEGTYKLDPAKKLKEIDASGIVLPGKRSRSFAGIYEIEGNTLKWCVDNQQKERPSEFRTVRGQYLLILRRMK